MDKFSEKYQTESVGKNFISDPKSWLEKKALEFSLHYLIAYADDGVITGKIIAKELVLSSKVFSETGPDSLKVLLNSNTLQSLRLFGPQGELNLWQTSQGFQYRLIKDDESFDCIEEVYWLWGNGTDRIADFTLMEEGQQGFLYGLPIADVDDKSRWGLRVRHFIDYEEGGQAFIAASRLLDFEPVEGGAK